MPLTGEARPSRLFRQSKRFRAEARAFGARVRDLRHGRGWTLETAAERALLDLKHFQKIEAGTINVTLVTLVRLAAGFGVPLSELFSTSSSPGRPRRRG
jgi:transcriptional regulator with XRE-family HTH domain